MLAVTERRTPEEMDELVDIIKDINKEEAKA